MSGRDDLAWWQRAILYEIYPKSFQDTTGNGIGDLPGITKRLEYLQALGVGAVWLTPMYASPMIDGGYDVADYYRVNPLFGTMRDMEELIARARERDIRIVMDLVFNHTSDQNAWFVDSASSCSNEHADWYIWRDPKEDGSAPTNWRSIFGGSAWTWCEARQQYYLHTFAREQPDLNWENPTVRRALADVANFWTQKGVGGFRIDAISYIKKPPFVDGTPDAADGLVNIHDMTANTEGILDFLHEFRDRTRTGHDIFTVGEANGVSACDLELWVGEHGVFDMLLEFDHMKIPLGGSEIWYKATDWKLTDLKTVFAASQHHTARNGWYPMYWENHDQPRSIDHFFPVDTDPTHAAKVLGAIALTMRGTPFLFEGEELGYTNARWDSIGSFDDIQTKGTYDLALKDGCSALRALDACRAFSRDNARTPMQWDTSAQAGFTQATPWLPVHEDFAIQNAAVEEADADSVLNWYRTLARLRHDHAELVCGDWQELLPEDEHIFAYTRSDGTRTALIYANFSSETVSYAPDLVKDAHLLLASQHDPIPGVLRPLEVVIYER